MAENPALNFQLRGTLSATFCWKYFNNEIRKINIHTELFKEATMTLCILNNIYYESSNNHINLLIITHISITTLLINIFFPFFYTLNTLILKLHICYKKLRETVISPLSFMIVACLVP